jgi:hypothetical protein
MVFALYYTNFLKIFQFITKLSRTAEKGILRQYQIRVRMEEMNVNG